MISVDAALSKIFDLITPLGTEEITLPDAAGRILRSPARADRDQPPFAAAAMDGYAISVPANPGMRLNVIGTAAAGHAFQGKVQAGQAVRIFTGAPVPEGTACIVIQEETTRDGDQITVHCNVDANLHIRPQGIDFKAGDQISAPRRLSGSEVSLLAAMNCARLSVSLRPDVAIIATGDELVMPGEVPRHDQIIASNVFAIKALAEAEGAKARILPIARDNADSLRAVLELAEGADLIVTIGGASVGDHDIVGPVAESMGATRSFYKVALRPGKPLMAGHLGGAVLLGLPGNPVSSIVCAHLFMRPALRAMQGLGAYPLPTATAKLACDLPANGPRAHYMRATLGPGPVITPMPNQDSALLSVLSNASALLIQPTGDGARKAGEQMRYIAL